MKSLEGMKCQAPHTHSWGDTVYHNAMVCGIVTSEETQSFNDIQVTKLSTPTFIFYANSYFTLGQSYVH